MTNPWKSRPLIICATPIVGIMFQIILMSFDSGPGDKTIFRANRVLEVGYLTFVMLLPLFSLPALSAAIVGIKTPQYRGWNMASTVLNSAYILLFLLLCTLLIISRLVRLR
jgi:hypothetical protein